MDNKPLLSILIPTKNREEYTLSVVQQILRLEDDRFQLVIQDNSNSDLLNKLLKKHLDNDSRIEYYYHEGILSFIDNFSFGINKCRGEYVTIIGDDDCINPAIFDVVEWAFKNNIQGITPSLPLIYYWPKSGIKANDDSGRLTIKDFSCNSRFYDPKNELRKLLKDGCQNYLSYNLAKVYHGVIKRSVLEELKDITGSYIGGLSPDIYLSVGLSSLIDKVLVIDYPLTISGICKNSGSADSASGKHTGKLEQAPHFIGHSTYEWSDMIPKFYSVETIWGDSALASLNDINKDLIRYFNVDVISAYCLNRYPQFKSEILENLSRNRHTPIDSYQIRFHVICGYILGPLKTLLKKIINRAFNQKSVQIFDDIEDINDALTLIQEKIYKRNKLLFSKLATLKQ